MILVNVSLRVFLDTFRIFETATKHTLISESSFASSKIKNCSSEDKKKKKKNPTYVFTCCPQVKNELQTTGGKLGSEELKN